MTLINQQPSPIIEPSIQQLTKPSLPQQSINVNNSKQLFKSYDETDPQYLKYSPQKQLDKRLQHKLTLLRFVFDLHQFIINKQRQRSLRVGLFINHSKQPLFNDILTLKNPKLKNLLMDDIFHSDLNKLKLIKSQLQQNIKTIFRHLYQVKRNLQQINKIKMALKQKVEQNRHLSSCLLIKQNISSNQLLTKQNFQLYLQALYEYLFIQFGDIELFDCLKQIGLRWVCDGYKLQEQRYLNVLGQKKQQTNNTKQNSFPIKKSSNNSTLQTNSTIDSSIYNQSQLTIQQNQPIRDEQKSQQAFLGLLHESRTKSNYNILYFSAFLPVDNFIKPCCTQFLFKHSQILSNKFNSNPTNNHIIFITKQSLKLNSQENQITLKYFQQPIKQAITALLNNHGGFIFVGFKKNSFSYTPQSPFLISQDSIKIIRKKLEQFIGKQITLLTSNNKKQQIPFKKFQVDFIPIFKAIDKQFNNDKIKGLGTKGEFVWRITVQPDNQHKLKMHSIGEVFYDLDQENETFIPITDTQDQKDRIYKKLKKTQNYYNRYRTQKQVIQKQNPYKITTHSQKCQKPIDSYFKQKCQQLDMKNLQSTVQQKKKTQKPIIKAQQTKIQQTIKNIDYTQQSKVDFKQVNLIVLQTKNIKQSCQKYFEEKKIQFKMQKLQTDYLKKLSKQTYVIYHHKKYDEINIHLNQFKKGYNSKKNISLISAQKSVYVDGLLDSQKLIEIKKHVMTEITNFEQEAISYAEQLKDKQQKSYIKATTKMGGIYLYFILNEMNFKPKMKNVPPNLQTFLVNLDQAIKQKQSQQLKRNHNTTNWDNNKQSYKGQKNGNKNNRNYQINNNTLDNKGYQQYSMQNNQYSGNMIQNNVNQWNNFVDSKYLQERQVQFSKCIERYNTLLNEIKDRNLAMQQFYDRLSKNQNDWKNFWHYQLNNEQFFMQINYKYQNPNYQFGSFYMQQQFNYYQQQYY